MSSTFGRYTLQSAQSAEAKAFYDEQGFIIIDELFSTQAIQGLVDETVAIFSGERGDVDGMLEGNPGQAPADILKQYSAIHFPHKISDHVLDYVKNQEIAEVLQNLVSENVKCMQSMLFLKAPGKKGQSWHQDEYFIPTRDRSLIGAWIAIDDAEIDNGCLWIIPGSHKEGYLRQRVPYGGTEYADVDYASLEGWDEAKDAIPAEVKSGSVVFFNGYLLHSSLSNKTTDSYRRALVNHYMSAESWLPWDQDGRLTLTEDMRDIVMVAGKDPFDYKGTKDLSQPFLRPDVLVFKKD